MVANWLVQKPLQILLIIVVALLARAILHRVISRLAKRAAEGTVPSVLSRERKLLETAASPLFRAASAARENGRLLLKSITTGVIFSIAFVTILAELGMNIAPLLASAGIAGVALGFGAQSLVKDFISGIFMVLEDQYGVGDAIDMGEAKGVVESVGLRVTDFALDGSVWYVRNGEVIRVGNNGQGWARAVIDVPVAYDEDVERVRDLLLETANDVVDEEPYKGMVLEPPEVWGRDTVAGCGGDPPRRQDPAGEEGRHRPCPAPAHQGRLRRTRGRTAGDPEHPGSGECAAADAGDQGLCNRAVIGPRCEASASARD